MPHRPVLLLETVRLLAPERGGLFVDATLGPGGHSEAILDASEQTRVLGIDRDAEALRLAQERLARFGRRFRAVHANHRDLARVMKEAGEDRANGVLADLGVSSLQFDTAERGFSFRHDAPLDMRMDPSGDDETAADLLLRLPEEEIARIIFEFGEERRSRQIARRIVSRRERGEAIKTTTELSELVARIVGHRKRDRIHPATRTFQALRIAVNRELESLEQFIETAVDLLQSGGRLAVISFHSLEDRMVKRALRRLSGRCECGPRVPRCTCGARRVVDLLTRRPLTPSESEAEANPRARSAKLRASVKI
jgi:16S rRNA (cytosine1402-N4)-methyltransferase